MNTAFKWGLIVSAALHAALLVSPLPEIIAGGEAPGRLITASLLRIESPVPGREVGSLEPGPLEEAAELLPDAVEAGPVQEEEKPAAPVRKPDRREEVLPPEPGDEEAGPDPREEDTGLGELMVKREETVAADEAKTPEVGRPAPVFPSTVVETFRPPAVVRASFDRRGEGEAGAVEPGDALTGPAGGRPSPGEGNGQDRDESGPGESPVAMRPPAQSDPAGSRGDPTDLLALIRSRILAARRYPEMARRKGWQGRAAVRFRIDREGRPDYLELVESSGFTVLDKASLKAVDGGAPYPPVEGWITVPIVFRLRG